jgi:hypothetical protein
MLYLLSGFPHSALQLLFFLSIARSHVVPHPRASVVGKITLYRQYKQHIIYFCMLFYVYLHALVWVGLWVRLTLPLYFFPLGETLIIDPLSESLPHSKLTHPLPFS